MAACEQTRGQSVLDHGRSVHARLRSLVEGTGDWRLPAWFPAYRDRLVASLHPPATLERYAVYHDAGKPFARVVEDGKVRFPDHAEVSARVYRETFSGDADVETVSRLIRHDMALHVATAKEVEELCRSSWSVRDASSLLLTGLAEVHSNAALFGGISSTSFLSKFKHLERRGKQVCKLYFGESE